MKRAPKGPIRSRRAHGRSIGNAIKRREAMRSSKGKGEPRRLGHHEAHHGSATSHLRDDARE